jgi:glycosyltransferase involved in cell wall biosynthesis
MNILMCHNYYQQPGGEDQSFASEAALLERYGHNVTRYTLHNSAINDAPRWRVMTDSLWNGVAYRELRQLIRRVRPEVVHCTNTFPLMSPSVYYAARTQRVPVVQSLRNYRLLCAKAQFFRDGSVCESCLGKSVGWPGIVHRCYRNSRLGTAVVGGITVAHRLLRTWTHAVDLYFTLTNFARQRFVNGGLPAHKIVVKPNFVDPDPGPGTGRGGYVAFVGRLSPEKGIDTLLAAWAQLKSGFRLKIVGDGPLANLVESAAGADARIQWLRRRPQEEVLDILGKAACLVIPSVWYETFGRAIIEAFAKGTPVIASRLGAMAELVDDGRTGRLFTPSDPEDLRSKLRQFLADPARWGRLRHAARLEYESRYTGDRNIEMLLEIYRRASQMAHGTSTVCSACPSAQGASWASPSAFDGTGACQP